MLSFSIASRTDCDRRVKFKGNSLTRRIIQIGNTFFSAGTTTKTKINCWCWRTFLNFAFLLNVLKSLSFNDEIVSCFTMSPISECRKSFALEEYNQRCLIISLFGFRGIFSSVHTRDFGETYSKSHQQKFYSTISMLFFIKNIYLLLSAVEIAMKFHKSLSNNASVLYKIIGKESFSSAMGLLYTSTKKT